MLINRNTLRNGAEKALHCRYLLAAIAFLVIVLLRLHGSSIGVYDRILADQPASQGSTNILGESRDIRSDEWAVQTPFYLAQSESSSFYPVVNKNLSLDGQNMILSYNAPVWDITALAKPVNWGFLLLGRDYGLSWYWGLKLLLLLLLSYELCMILTKRNRLLSVLGSLLITFAPGTQWWFMQHVGDLLLFLQAIVVTFYYYLKFHESLLRRVGMGVLFSLASVGFALVLYPAFQVPFGYLGLALLILIATDFRGRLKLDKADILIAAGAVLIIGGLLLHAVMISKDAIIATLQTVYPGKRISFGGGAGLPSINQFLTNIFLPYKDVTFRNDCEVAGFFNFLPVVLLAFPLFIAKKRGGRVEGLKYGITLAAISVFCVLYVLLPFPQLFAKVTLLSYTTNNRMLLVYGLAAAYLTIWAAGSLSRGRQSGRLYAALVSLALAVFYLATVLCSPMKDYMPLWAYLLLIVVLAAAAYLMLRGKKRGFAAVMTLVILIAGLPVNPLAQGSSAIYGKSLSYRVQQIRKTDGQAVWVSDSAVMGSFLQANGVKSLSGVNFYPDLRQWALIDPTGRYNKVYNRYAHIAFKPVSGKSEFVLRQADSYIVDISPMDMKKLHVKYILAKHDYNKFPALSGRFKQIYGADKDGFRIFEVNYT